MGVEIPVFGNWGDREDVVDGVGTLKVNDRTDMETEEEVAGGALTSSTSVTAA